MSSPTPTLSDDDVERFLGTLLRSGVVVAGGVVLFGGFLYLMRYGNTVPDYHVFHGEPGALRTVVGIVKNALSLSSRGLIQLGLLLLIATPLLRVVFSVIAFAFQRDLTYLLVTLIVFCVLLYSLLGGGL
jgi:uncharacterized membrane protein